MQARASQPGGSAGGVFGIWAAADDDQDWTCIGTAMAIGPGTVITCGHVLWDSFKNSPHPSSSLQLRTSVDAAGVGVLNYVLHGRLDLARLELAQPVASLAMPLLVGVPLTPRIWDELSIELWGHGGAGAGAARRFRVSRTLLVGSDEGGRHPELVQLAGGIPAGFSGGPAFAHLGRRQVCVGMAVMGGERGVQMQLMTLDAVHTGLATMAGGLDRQVESEWSEWIDWRTWRERGMARVATRWRQIASLAALGSLVCMGLMVRQPDERAPDETPESGVVSVFAVAAADGVSRIVIDSEGSGSRDDLRWFAVSDRPRPVRQIRRIDGTRQVSPLDCSDASVGYVCPIDDVAAGWIVVGGAALDEHELAEQVGDRPEHTDAEPRCLVVP